MDNIFLDDHSADAYIDKILTLAALSLYGENVEIALLVVIHKACRHLVLNKPGDPERNLLAFKRHLMTVADSTHHSLPNCKKNLVYAASLIAVDPVYLPECSVELAVDENFSHGLQSDSNDF
jgi:hypothetical protein